MNYRFNLDFSQIIQSLKTVNRQLFYFQKSAMYTALEDIKLETIDFDWIKQTTKTSHLKRAIKLIQHDGNYFKQLKDACFTRLQELDPSLKRIVVDNQASMETKLILQKQLEDWENSLENKNTKKIEFQRNLDDTEAYFEKDNKPKEAKKEAERQRNKGNEAIRSKDFDEAIGYYTKSLSYDPGMYQSYCNRALAHLKKKDFQKCLDDCESALRLNSKYTKAHHRKAKAYLGMKKRVEAYKTFQQALKIQPENSQINGQIQQLWQDLSQHERNQLEGKTLIKVSQFKKITIEEESEESEGDENA